MKAATKPIRIVLADNHPIVRAGIREALKELAGVEVVGEANDGREAIELVKSLSPDLVFMDISMPGLNGLEATVRITRDFPNARVVILSKHEEEPYFWDALRKGACGYLLKRSALAELRKAVHRVAGGEIFLSEEISGRLAKKLPLQQVVSQKNPLDRLTERQREILQLIAEGQTTKAIALILKVSPKTVEYHRMQMMQSLKIYDIPGLVRFALRERLISAEY
jgi:DNA-binding NarL/FixJ family response regulator